MHRGLQRILVRDQLENSGLRERGRTGATGTQASRGKDRGANLSLCGRTRNAQE